MWPFSRSTTNDSENSDLKEITHAQRQRNKQIEWLREKVINLLEIERDKRYRVIINHITLDINLSDRFPFEGPVVTASPFFVHPWFDQQMVVIGCPLLKQFNPHCNLGTVIQQIIDELINNPPQFDHTVTMTTQPQMYQPQMAHITYPPIGVGGGGSLLDTPFSFSSAPQHLHYSQTASIDTPPPLRSSSGTIPTVATATDRYSVPTNLPGLSEKTDEQLTKYLKDEDAVVMIDRFISRLDVINKVQQEMESLFLTNEENSRQNIEMEPQLQSRWGSLQEEFLELQTLKHNFDKLYEKQIRLLERYDRKIAYETLKASCQTADTNSEIIAEDFMDRKMDSVTFLQKYINERKLYHLRSAKSEMLKHNRQQ